MQFCVCCIGFQEQLLSYLDLTTNSTHITLTLHGYPTIVWFMFGIRFMFIALFCPKEAISDLADFPWAYDLGFDVPGFAEKEELEREREIEEALQAELEEEAERRKKDEDVIVDVMIDDYGNLMVDEDGEYVTMRIYSMNTTEAPTISSTPIPLTPPPAQVGDPFNPFTGNFN